MLVAGCGSAPEAPAKAAPDPSTSATPRAGVEVLDPVLVMNDDGSATLSARIVNHTDEDVVIINLDAYEVYPVRYFSGAADRAFEPGATTKDRQDRASPLRRDAGRLDQHACRCPHLRA